MTTTSTAIMIARSTAVQEWARNLDRRAAGARFAAASSVRRPLGAPHSTSPRHGRRRPAQPALAVTEATSAGVSLIAAAATLSSRWDTDPGARDRQDRRRPGQQARRARSAAASRRSAAPARARTGCCRGPGSAPTAGTRSAPVRTGRRVDSDRRSSTLYLFWIDTIGVSSLCAPQLVLGDVGQPDVPDLALLLEGDECTDRVLQRHRGVGPVELVQRDLFELEPSQASLAGLDQVVRPAVLRPLPGTGALEAALGRDHEIIRVRRQRLADELLADVRTVGVGGVDEVDAELDRAPQHRLRLVAVGGLAPDSRGR